MIKIDIEGKMQIKWEFIEVKREVNYEKYVFPYRVYAQVCFTNKESEIADVYSLGLLPMRNFNNRFYLARSVRINFAKFKLNSENKRILRKTQYLNLKKQILPLRNFDYSISKLAVEYYKNRFDKVLISPQRMRKLCTKSHFNLLLTYFDGQQIVGYCIGMIGKNILHYSYPFYNINYYKKNIGMGMMLKAILYAQKQGMQFIYLGTCYSKAARYKLQFSELEWFDGIKWHSDITKLKALLK